MPSEKQSERTPETLRQQVFESLKRLGIDNPAGMTGNDLKILLAEKKALPEENGEALLQLLKSIDQAIYTPGSTSTREMDSLYQQAKKVLDTITSK